MLRFQLFTIIILGLVINAKISYSDTSDDYGTWSLVEQSGQKTLKFTSSNTCLISYNPTQPIKLLVPRLELVATRNLINNCTSNNLSYCLKSLFNLAFSTTNAREMTKTTGQYLSEALPGNYEQNEFLGIVKYDLFRTGSIVRNQKTYFPALIYVSSGFTRALFWDNPKFNTTHLDFPLFVYIEADGFSGTQEFTMVDISLNSQSEDILHTLDSNLKSETETCF
ncbi:MAG: hypothetical protein KBD78_11340 [Oligoflexales bacterium]|nr:hypothetical protein [Oligoflexales bacterium]